MEARNITQFVDSANIDSCKIYYQSMSLDMVLCVTLSSRSVTLVGRCTTLHSRLFRITEGLAESNIDDLSRRKQGINENFVLMTVSLVN